MEVLGVFDEALHVRLATVIDDEDYGLRDGGKEQNDGVDKGALELHISADVLILFRQVMQTYVVERVVINPEEDDDLPEERYPEPYVPDGMWSTHTRNLLERLGVGEEVKVDGGQDTQHQRLPF